MSDTTETPDTDRVRLDEQARLLVDAPNFAHLSTLMPDGSPKVEPVWVGREGDDLLVTTDAKALKARNIARDARVALSIVDFDNPYQQLLVRGTVREIRADEDLAVMDRMSRKYLDQPFPRRRWSERVVFVIEPTTARYYVSPLKDPRTPVQDL